MIGFIKISRKLFQNPFWNEAREYSKAEAWLDLIQLARFEASTEIIQGKVIELEKGEVPASRRYLEERWSWGSTKVGNFLKTLEKLDMVNRRQTAGQTILKLVKYRVYNESQTTDQAKNKPRANHGQTTGKPNIKKEKKEKELKELKENKKKTSFSPPPCFLEFKEYSLKNSKNVDLEKLELKYKSWIENKWKDGHDNPIKNWKAKILNTLPYLKKEKSFVKKEINQEKIRIRNR